MARRESQLRARLRLPQGLIERITTAAQPPRRDGSRIAQGKRSAALGMPAKNVSAPRRGAAKSLPGATLHAERVGDHKPKPRKSPPGAPSRQSPRP
jgi:hypothetical protein